MKRLKNQKKGLKRGHIEGAERGVDSRTAAAITSALPAISVATRDITSAQKQNDTCSNRKIKTEKSCFNK